MVSMLTFMFRDFAQEDQTLIHVVVLLFVSLFSASLRVSSTVSLEVRGNLDWSAAGKLFVSKVVSVKAGRSLAVLVVLLVLLISVSVSFSLLSKLSKSIVLNRLSNSKENISE